MYKRMLELTEVQMLAETTIFMAREAKAVLCDVTTLAVMGSVC